MSDCGGGAAVSATLARATLSAGVRSSWPKGSATAVLTNVCPAWSGRERAVTRICATSSRAIRPSAQFGGAQVPWLGTSETSSSPAGTRSRNTTRRAVLGPALRTVTVNWMSDPAGIDGAAATFVTTRSTSERIRTTALSTLLRRFQLALRRRARSRRRAAIRPPVSRPAAATTPTVSACPRRSTPIVQDGACARALAAAQGDELEPGGQHVAHPDPGRAARAEVRDRRAGSRRARRGRSARAPRA